MPQRSGIQIEKRKQSTNNSNGNLIDGQQRYVNSLDANAAQPCTNKNISPNN